MLGKELETLISAQTKPTNISPMFSSSDSTSSSSSSSSSRSFGISSGQLTNNLDSNSFSIELIEVKFEF